MNRAQSHLNEAQAKEVLESILQRTSSVRDAERRLERELGYKASPITAGLPFHDRDSWRPEYSGGKGGKRPRRSISIYWQGKLITASTT